MAPNLVQMTQGCFVTKMEISAPPASFQCEKLSTGCQKMRTIAPADQVSVMIPQDCIAHILLIDVLLRHSVLLALTM